MIARRLVIKQSKFFPVFIFLAAIALCFAHNFLEKTSMYYINRAERISFLVDELTTTPMRRQRALDEIVKDGDGAFIYLLKYLGDQRALADGEALFLNMHPNTSERYFHAGGKRVDETILRYLCWRTEACDVQFDMSDAKSMKVQRDKIERYCRENFKNPGLYEN